MLFFMQNTSFSSNQDLFFKYSKLLFDKTSNSGLCGWSNKMRVVNLDTRIGEIGRVEGNKSGMFACFEV